MCIKEHITWYGCPCRSTATRIETCRQAKHASRCCFGGLRKCHTAERSISEFKSCPKCRAKARTAERRRIEGETRIQIPGRASLSMPRRRRTPVPPFKVKRTARKPAKHPDSHAGPDVVSYVVNLSGMTTADLKWERVRDQQLQKAYRTQYPGQSIQRADTAWGKGSPATRTKHRSHRHSDPDLLCHRRRAADGLSDAAERRAANPARMVGLMAGLNSARRGPGTFRGRE